MAAAFAAKRMETFNREEMKTLLRAHAVRYPLMEATDGVKLLYQSVFGPGHMIPDEAACRAYLEMERASVISAEMPPEDIGGGLVRLHLSTANALGLSSRDVVGMFARSAERCKGEKDTFLLALSLLEEMTAAGEMPFRAEELETYLSSYRALGYPAVSHSETFRKAYNPHYRVIHKDFLRVLPVFAATDRLLREKKQLTVVIDGRCASGKTTAANLLAGVWNAPVIRMDDFFLPPDLRTAERYLTPGGNVHYERFAEEVLPGLREGSAFAYRKFDCGKMILQETETLIPEAPVRIVEGTYSLHPFFGDYADLTVFSDVAPEEQMKRLLRRDGDYAEVFREKWIPMEEAYFRAFDPAKRCAVIL